MLLRWSLGQAAAADAIESAVGQALDAGFRTADLWPGAGQPSNGLVRVGTTGMAAAIVERIASSRGPAPEAVG